MGLKRAPSNVKGFKGDAPYLCRVSKKYPDFSGVILLLTRDTTKILVGSYTGTREDLRETYRNGASFPLGYGIALCHIIPLNKERKERGEE
jgi:hypothetical protein